MTTCLKVSDVVGGESGGLWGLARRHCSIKKLDGFFLGSKEGERRVIRSSSKSKEEY